MNKKQLATLYNYFMRYEISLENTVMQLQQNIRYRRIDAIDCVELMLAVERLNTFRETRSNILDILKFDKPTRKAIELLDTLAETGYFDDEP